MRPGPLAAASLALLLTGLPAAGLGGGTATDHRCTAVGANLPLGMSGGSCTILACESPFFLYAVGPPGTWARARCEAGLEAECVVGVDEVCFLDFTGHPGVGGRGLCEHRVGLPGAYVVSCGNLAP